MEEKIEKIMQICSEALEKEGYEVYGYSEGFGKFTVSCDGEEDIIVDFDLIS